MVNFSVIIPTHNRNNFLSRAIKLSLSQRKMPFEILIIDDCDNFETKKIVKKFDKKFRYVSIKYLKNEKKNNALISRNIGVVQAKGNFIAFLDDDDYWFSNKLEKQIDKLESSELKMVCSEATSSLGLFVENTKKRLFNSDVVYKEVSKIYKNSLMKKEFQRKRVYNFEYPQIWTSKFIKIHNCIITSSVVIEKEILDKIGNFRDIQSKKLWADWDCWLGLLTHTDCYYFSEPLLYYNLSDGLNSNPL